MALWSAHDVAEAYEWQTSHAAATTIKRWREAGLVKQAGTDSITGAALYDPEEIRAARRADLDELGNPSQTRRP